MMKIKKITLKVIASQLDVSESTVSLALNNHPQVAFKTKGKIKRMASELGYDFSLKAKTQKTRSVPLKRVQSDTITSLVTIYSIATRVGFSASTVSRVLNGKGCVAAATAEAVTNKAKEMGYQTNVLARILRVNYLDHDISKANRTTTIYDIAKSVGLSASTVSRCLDDRVKANQITKQKVLFAAREMGYKKNDAAKQLRVRS